MSSESFSLEQRSSPSENSELNRLAFDPDIYESERILNNALNPENEKGPTIEFHIFYSKHKTSTDAEGLREACEKADVFIPEGMGWNEAWVEGYQKVSDGIMSPDEFEKKFPTIRNMPQYGFLRNQLEVIYGSCLHIVFVDLPQGHPLIERHREIESDLSPYINVSFEEFLELYKNLAKSIAEFQKDREVYMFEELKKLALVLKTGKVKPGRYLSDDKRESVLLSLGQFHTALYHDMQRSGMPSSREFFKNPGYGHQMELMRRFRFGKEADNEVVARAFVETLFDKTWGDTLENYPVDSRTLETYTRKITSSFTLEDVKSLWEESRKNGAKHSLDSLSSLFEKKLKEKGIFMPRSGEELEEFSCAGVQK